MTFVLIDLPRKLGLMCTFRNFGLMCIDVFGNIFPSHNVFLLFVTSAPNWADPSIGKENNNCKNWDFGYVNAFARTTSWLNKINKNGKGKKHNFMNWTLSELRVISFSLDSLLLFAYVACNVNAYGLTQRVVSFTVESDLYYVVDHG